MLYFTTESKHPKSEHAQRQSFCFFLLDTEGRVQTKHGWEGGKRKNRTNQTNYFSRDILKATISLVPLVEMSLFFPFLFRDLFYLLFSVLCTISLLTLY
jgi:hypothetical protein